MIIQLLSCVQLVLTPWITAHQAACPSSSPGICSNSCPSSWCCIIQPSHLLLSLLSQHWSLFQWIKLFPSGGRSIGASLSSISPFNEYSGLIKLGQDYPNSGLVCLHSLWWLLIGFLSLVLLFLPYCVYSFTFISLLNEFFFFCPTYLGLVFSIFTMCI